MSDYSRFEISQAVIESVGSMLRTAVSDYIRSLGDSSEIWERAANAMREFAHQCAGIEIEWYPGMKGRGIKVRQR